MTINKITNDIEELSARIDDIETKTDEIILDIVSRLQRIENDIKIPETSLAESISGYRPRHVQREPQ